MRPTATFRFAITWSKVMGRIAWDAMDANLQKLLEHIRRQVAKAPWLTLREEQEARNGPHLVTVVGQDSHGFQIRIAGGAGYATVAILRDGEPEARGRDIHRSQYGNAPEARRTQNLFTDALTRELGRYQPHVGAGDLQTRIQGLFDAYPEDAARMIAETLDRVLASSTLVEVDEALADSMDMGPAPGG